MSLKVDGSISPAVLCIVVASMGEIYGQTPTETPSNPINRGRQFPEAMMAPFEASAGVAPGWI